MSVHDGVAESTLGVSGVELHPLMDFEGRGRDIAAKWFPERHRGMYAPEAARSRCVAALREFVTAQPCGLPMGFPPPDFGQQLRDSLLRDHDDGTPPLFVPDSAGDDWPEGWYNIGGGQANYREWAYQREHHEVLGWGYSRRHKLTAQDVGQGSPKGGAA